MARMETRSDYRNRASKNWKVRCLQKECPGYSSWFPTVNSYSSADRFRLTRVLTWLRYAGILFDRRRRMPDEWPGILHIYGCTLATHGKCRANLHIPRNLNKTHLKHNKNIQKITVFQVTGNTMEGERWRFQDVSETMEYDGWKLQMNPVHVKGKWEGKCTQQPAPSKIHGITPVSTFSLCQFLHIKVNTGLEQLTIRSAPDVAS